MSLKLLEYECFLARAADEQAALHGWAPHALFTPPDALVCLVTFECIASSTAAVI